jgi:bacillithiol biosynthesis cysteine-adding enzyme BshC
MKAKYIDYEETHCFPDTAIRYLQQEASLKPLLNQFPTLAHFKKIIAERKFDGNRIQLVEVLNQQYQNIPQQSALLKSNFASLKEDQTFTITTGHQLNIFTGPLYFIFKIVTAINLAKQLQNENPAQKFVPVYWMASEDHDFEEINHTYIGGKKIQWQIAATGATGRILTQSILKALNDYKGVLGISIHAEKLASIVTQAYTQYPNLADATRFLVNALFGDYGLVIIDADDERFKQQFASIIEQDIIQQNSFQHISKSNEALALLNIQAQVNPREINFFYLLDGLRERIVFEQGKYQILNSDISFSEAALKVEIHTHPERFSPNVVMRPLYQEVILPNLAYVGGGGELAYWLQLKANFDFYKVDFPVLILRNSAMLSDEKTAHQLEKLGLNFSTIFEQTEKLKNAYVRKNSLQTLNVQGEWKQFEAVFDTLKERVNQIDSTLKPSTEAVAIRLKKALSNLEKKMLKAEKRNFSEALQTIENIKSQLFPGGELQERKENFGLYYVKYGDDFIAHLIHHFEPLAFKFTILY